MGNVLTTDSRVTCGHSGNVEVTSTQKLKVSNNSVLVKTSIEGKSIPVIPSPGCCQTQPVSDASGTTANPCTTVSSVTRGEATKLKVNGQAVMLDTLAGETNGMVLKIRPQKLLSATAGQTKLMAI